MRELLGGPLGTLASMALHALTAFVDGGRADAAAAARFWALVTGGTLSSWREGGDFVTVRAPGGTTYCLTDRDPATGNLTVR